MWYVLMSFPALSWPLFQYIIIFICVYVFSTKVSESSIAHLYTSRSLTQGLFYSALNKSLDSSLPYIFWIFSLPFQMPRLSESKFEAIIPCCTLIVLFFNVICQFSDGLRNQESETEVSKTNPASSCLPVPSLRQLTFSARWRSWFISKIFLGSSDLL